MILQSASAAQSMWDHRNMPRVSAVGGTPLHEAAGQLTMRLDDEGEVQPSLSRPRAGQFGHLSGGMPWNPVTPSVS